MHLKLIYLYVTWLFSCILLRGVLLHYISDIQIAQYEGGRANITT